MAFGFRAIRTGGTNNNIFSMWKDSETKIDYLNFDYLVKAVEDIVMDDSLTPSTIGVYGDWGSGKSSLMQMVENRLIDKYDDDVACIHFNGWLFEGYEDAKTAFCGTILEELRKHKTIPSKVKGQITSLLKKIDGKKILMKGGSIALDVILTGGIGSLAGLTVESIVSTLKNKIDGISADDIREALKDYKKENEDKKREEVKNFQKDFENILKESNIKRMVVFVDELDRCKPDTVLDIFEAMRLFLFVKGSSFVIGADSRLIDYAIKSRYKNIPGNHLDISKEYLEKLIQYPVTIPQLDKNELEKYLTCLLLEKDIDNVAKVVNKGSPYEPINLQQLIEGHKEKEEAIKNAIALSRQVSYILAAKLNGNPRQCKRFFNTLFMRLSMAKFRNITLDKNVLAKLMLLEYFKDSMYVMVVDANNSKDLAELESNKLSDGNAFTKWASDDWVKEWLAIDVRLSGIDLRDYYFFSRSTQRVDMSIKELLSPDADKCLEYLLDKTDSNRRKAMELIVRVGTGEVSLILDHIYDKMLSSDDIDTDWFKSYVAVLSIDSMLSLAPSRIKSIPLEKYNVGLVAQMLPLLSKVKEEQKNEITAFLSKKEELASVLESTNKITGKTKK